MTPPVAEPGRERAMSLEGRIVVVTGAASGIGRQTCTQLRQRGAEVVALDREPIDGPGPSVRADLSDPAGVDRAVEQLPARIDGLCAIAGVPGTAGVETVRAVNYLGLRHLVDRVLDRIPPGGSIAAAASIAGAHWRDRLALHLELAAAASWDDALAWCRAHPVDDQQSYPFFKEALIVWTIRTAALLAPRGIRVNCVSPGPVDTPILRDFRTSIGVEKVRLEIEKVGRAGLPTDIAPAFAFLMSPDSSWVSGVDLACDGGLAAMTRAFEPDALEPDAVEPDVSEPAGAGLS